MAYKFQLGTAKLSGSIQSVTDDEHDLGASGAEYRNLFLDGTANVDAINLNGTAITATGAEINILDGVTSTASELNLVDGSSAGSIVNSKAVIYGSSGEVDMTTLQIGGVSVTSTAAELNILDGVTSTAAELNLVDGSTANTVVNSKAVIYGSSGEVKIGSLESAGGTLIDSSGNFTGADATFALVSGSQCLINGDLEASGNVVFGSAVTATHDVRGYMDFSDADGAAYGIKLNGTLVTSTAAELNIMDGVIATTAEINLLDGVTATTGELNILDGVTSTAAELNLVDGSSAGSIVNSKAVIYGSSGEVDMTTLQIGGVSVTSTAAELNILDGVTSTASELNLVDGSSAGAIVNSKAVIYGSSGEVDMTTLQIGGVSVTSTAAELNILDGVTATAAEINLLDGSTAGSAVAGTALVVDAARNIGNINQLTASYARIEELDVITINSVAQTNQTLEIVDKLIIAASGAASVNAADGGLQIGGSNGSDTVASVLYDHANLALDFNIGGTTEIRLEDGVLRPETDDDVDLGASGAEFKDLYIDGVAYLDSIDLNGTAITSTAAEINLLDGASAGTAVNSKAVIYGSAGEVNATSLEVGGVAITATPAEINLLDAGSGTAVGLQGSDGFIMFDNSASDVAKKVLVSDMADFVGENLSEKITRVAAGATHNHAFATHGSILSVDGSGAAVTINLPAVSAANDGKVLKIKKYAGSADITINRSGAGQDIDGLASIKLESDHAAISLIFDYNGGTDPRYFVL